MLGNGATPHTDRSPGVEDVSERVRELTARHLGYALADVRVDTPFLDLGADSLTMINMLRELEGEFSVRVAMRELFDEGDTPARLSRLVVARIGAGPATPAAAAAPPPAAAAATVTPALAAPAPVSARRPRPRRSRPRRSRPRPPWSRSRPRRYRPPWRSRR
ncbi:acyl carrier protein [Polymorphospora rubra]|uniref:Carrier domain-containing protein n=1 Tax=Polymorphospora rubra TaxID=338584 RepID=A0A810N5N7_9ACTN|nr:acyl carrier protein [Polymorphospora rubra]BCJ67499.1 hypothetical protein Prubr_45200 [Polymorphospora rubra]